MERTCWLGRRRASIDNARGALGAEARLVHLAGSYGLKAANAGARDRAGIPLDASAAGALALPTRRI